jgi:hypothetical protein
VLIVAKILKKVIHKRLFIHAQEHSLIFPLILQEYSLQNDVNQSECKSLKCDDACQVLEMGITNANIEEL